MQQTSLILEAKEVNIRDLLRDKFFEIPIYQRPLSWTEDNFQKLVEDIKDAIDSGEEGYFLGAIILKRIDDITFEIVDGQQRLTSLLILLAVCRDYLKDNKLHKWLMDEGDEYAGIPARERVKVWKDLYKLFQEYVYKPGGTTRFLEDFEAKKIQYPDKDSPFYHLYEAIKSFRNFVEELSEEDIKRFLQYLFEKVYLVRIITGSRSSAFRLFNILNTRGLPLSTADVLKSINLEALPDDDRRNYYFEEWRKIEEDIGRERLEDVISYVRLILKEEKAKKELVEEFEDIFKSGKIKKGAEFFDTILKYAELYRDRVLDAKINAIPPHKKVRYKTLMDLMVRFLPSSDWIPPLLLFCKKFKDENALYEFAFQLERKFFIEWCADFTATERITSSINLIRLIKKAKTPEDVLSSMFKHPEVVKRGRKSRKIDFMDHDAVKKILLSKLDDQHFYTLKGGKIARYLLLRLDMEMQGENFPGYANIPTITVEHILPRTPRGEWLSIFAKEDIDKIVNKLGNLTLLNRRRNSRASNYDFKKKKERYFDVERNPFAITAMLKEYDKWDIASFKERHKKLLDKAFEIYLF